MPWTFIEIVNMFFHIVTNHVFNERTKHVESDCHFNKDDIQAKVLSKNHVLTTNQLPDIFAKAQEDELFKQLCSSQTFKISIL